MTIQGETPIFGLFEFSEWNMSFHCKSRCRKNFHIYAKTEKNSKIAKANIFKISLEFLIEEKILKLCTYKRPWREDTCGLFFKVSMRTFFQKNLCVTLFSVLSEGQ